MQQSRSQTRVQDDHPHFLHREGQSVLTLTSPNVTACHLGRTWPPALWAVAGENAQQMTELY